MNVGSGPNGQPVLRLPCANLASQPQCDNFGNLSCSKCRLVKYCSKECQIEHWKFHRADCKGPVMDPNWHPGWAKERRMPDFFEPDPSKPASYSNLGPDQFSYVWGNVPAIDCLNLSNNEGATASTKNFKLCFAASGDIRNLVRTVNSLPENYTGQCDILFNDIDPRVVGRNLVVLWALLNPALPIEDVAELAMHLMYSSRLTSPMSAFLSRGLSVIRDLTYGDDLSIPFGGVGKLKAVLMPGNLDIVTEMLESRYGQRAAENSYSFVMCNAARRDYTDRYLDTLEPAHRLAFTHYRSTGILVPFSFNTNDFCEPNRLLYSSTGDWLLHDGDNPLFCWDVASVCAHGEKCGVNRSDSYGCLFFYVTNQLQIFARRLRECHINITMTMADAKLQLPAVLSTGFPVLLPFSLGCFDRIDTSNLADYVSPAGLLMVWAYFLNRDNKFAAILMYLMNWQQDYPIGEFDGKRFPKKELEKYTSLIGMDLQKFEEYALEGRMDTGFAAMTRFYGGILHFEDDHDQFQSYLRDQPIESAATVSSLQLRKINRVHPKRAGAPLDSPRLTIPSKLSKTEFYNTFWIGGSASTTRFVEFESSD